MLTVAIIIGLDQAGIDVAMLMIVIAIFGGGLMTAVILAFAMSARDCVGNLIGARNACQFLHSSMRLRVSDVEGQVIEVSHTHIALQTSEGKILLPAHTLETHGVVIIAPAAEGDQAHG